jgi:hypothetical protein
MRTAFIINLTAFSLTALFGIVAAFFEVDRVNAAIQQFPLSVVLFLPLMAFGLSAIYLLLHSWVMLIRFWRGREGSENLKLLLLLLLCFFSFLASYYFYWKRSDIDPHAA